MELGRVGIFSPELRLADPAACIDAVGELEALGYGSFWIPGGPDGSDIINVIDRLLAGGQTITGVASVLNLWVRDAVDVAADHAAVTSKHPGRFVLGLGVSHALFVEARGEKYENVVDLMRDYLDRVDAANPTVPKDERLLAALKPRMLELARERTSGSIPYLFSPEHLAWARGILGPGPILAPNLAVYLGSSTDRARAVGRRYMERYVDRLTYTRTLRAQGMTDDDFVDGCSDRLIDLVLAYGDLEAIAARVDALFEAGADHVSLQVLLDEEDYTNLPLDEWRHLASLIDPGGS